MSADLEERVYQSLTRAVIWGEPRESVFRIMEANGISGYHADAMFQRARRVRLAILRSEGWKRMMMGLGILLAAGGLFAVFWHGFGGITSKLYAFFGLGAVWGAWWTLDGLTSILFAHMKKGSVSTEI